MRTAKLHLPLNVWCVNTIRSFLFHYSFTSLPIVQQLYAWPKAF
nr:MAG TPA: hypothetical protein [Siphoviridae sp. ctpCx1]